MKFLINKIVVRKGDQDQYDIQVYEEGSGDDVLKDDFTDDYDSEELSVPEERAPDEYVFDESKDQPELEESDGNQGLQQQQSYYTEEDSAQIQPLNIAELDTLYQSVHGEKEDIKIWSESNFSSIIPQITHNSIFLNCYSEEIYDVLLEDLRKQYEFLIKE